MPYAYDTRGVKVRADGGGDAWARWHRQNLDDTYHMLDYDGWQIREQHMERTENTEDHLFIEVVLDGQKRQSIRQINYIALFDRKATLSAVHGAWFTRGCYLNMCRQLSIHQDIPCRFIYVIGGQEPPWTLIECSIFTGVFGEPITLDTQRQTWLKIWESIGLTQTRKRFEEQLDTYRKINP